MTRHPVTISVLDEHWARIVAPLMRDDKPAPTARKFLRYEIGNPGLDDTGAPAPIWLVHVALMRAHIIADACGVARVDRRTLAPRRGERERAWVDRATSELARWALRVTRTSRASRYVITGEPSANLVFDDGRAR